MKQLYLDKLDEFIDYELTRVMKIMDALEWEYAHTGRVKREHVIHCIRENFAVLENDPNLTESSSGMFEVHRNGAIKFVPAEVFGAEEKREIEALEAVN